MDMQCIISYEAELDQDWDKYVLLRELYIFLIAFQDLIYSPAKLLSNKY